MTYRLYRKEGFANADALNGGMSMSDAAAILSGESVDVSGGWAQDAAFPLEDVRELGQYVVDKYGLNPQMVLSMLNSIYNYDTALIYDDSTNAYDLKQRALNRFNNPVAREAAKKLWNYLRQKVHQGTTKPARLSGAQRAARRAQAQASRNTRYNVLRPAGYKWYGSNPYVMENGRSRRAGAYKGLMYRYNRPARIPATQRYGALTDQIVYPPEAVAAAAAAAAENME